MALGTWSVPEYPAVRARAVDKTGPVPKRGDRASEPQSGLPYRVGSGELAGQGPTGCFIQEGQEHPRSRDIRGRDPEEL